MGVEDEMNECTVSALTLQDIKSKDTDMSKRNWSSRLIRSALHDSSFTRRPQSVFPAKRDSSIRGKMRILKVSKQKYNDDVFRISDTNDDLVFQTSAVGSPSEDIFKVWDLECSFGEDELLKQFGNPLLAGLIQTDQHSDVRLGLKHQEVNHLTTGVADLPLKQGFGRPVCVTSGIAGMSLDQNPGPGSHS